MVQRVYARAALTRARRGPGGDGLFLCGRRRRSRSFTHVFQLYGGFLLRAVARTNCALASCRAQTPRCFLVSLLHASVDGDLERGNTRLLRNPGTFGSSDALHRSQMPSADEFDTLEPASQQNQLCKGDRSQQIKRRGRTFDADRRELSSMKARRVRNNAVPSQGDHRQRHGHARPELPPRGRGLARLAEQRALAAVQAGGAERAERLFARPRRRRGAAHSRGDRHRETPARHRRVLCRRGPGRRPGALRPAATEGRGRLLEEKSSRPPSKKKASGSPRSGACVRAVFSGLDFRVRRGAIPRLARFCHCGTVCGLMGIPGVRGNRASSDHRRRACRAFFAVPFFIRPAWASLLWLSYRYTNLASGR